MDAGFQEGNVFEGPQMVSNDDRMDDGPDEFAAERAKSAFSEFLLRFRVRNSFPYRDKLRQSWALGRMLLEVDLDELAAFDASLANVLQADPAEYIPLLEQAATTTAQAEFAGAGDGGQQQGINQQVQLLLRSSGNAFPIRQLNSTHVGRLVMVPGIVISASRVHAKATHVSVFCKNPECRYHTDPLEIACSSGFGGANIPKRCVEEEQSSNKNLKCGPSPYVIVGDRSRYCDHQVLKLQESPETVPTGDMPRHVQLAVDRYLVDKAAPGMRVTVIGVYMIPTGGGKKKPGKNGADNRTPYLRVVGMQMDREGAGRWRSQFTPEEEEQFLKLARRENIRELIANSIAPAIFGHEDIKRMVACLLFGGTRKFLPDGMRLRGDINVLLLGDPGTGKSQILKFAQEVAPVGVFTSGKGSSAAGLTASVVQDPASREFYLEGGAMVLADGGVVCIDEFDKMRLTDQVAIHEAMEQQTISIAKAGLCTVLNARTSVLAAANPIFGSYDDNRGADQNIQFHATILSRFDAIFLIKDRRNETQDKVIATHVINLHITRQTPHLEHETIPIDLLKRFIAYARANCHPRLEEEAAEELQNQYVMIRDSVRQRGVTGTAAPIPITVRQLEAIVRISEALAKQELSPVATRMHVQEAIRLFNVSTLDAASSGVASAENLPAELMQEIVAAENLLKRRLAIGSKMSERRLVDDLQNSSNISPDATRRAIHILVQRGELEFRAQRKAVLRKR